MDPYLLVATAACAAALLGVLSGVWIGFRVTTRDASILATLDTRVANALKASNAAMERSQLLEVSWAETLEDMERKRAKMRAAQQSAERTAAKATKEEEPPPSLDDLTPRERRRMIGRRLGAA